MRIAQHTGIRRPASHIFIHEIIDNVVAKFIANINDEVRKTHVDGYLTGVVNGVQAATAGLLFGPTTVGVIPGFHGNADDLVPLLVEHHGRNGRINAAAHRDEYTSVLTHIQYFTRRFNGLA